MAPGEGEGTNPLMLDLVHKARHHQEDITGALRCAPHPQRTCTSVCVCVGGGGGGENAYAAGAQARATQGAAAQGRGNGTLPAARNWESVLSVNHPFWSSTGSGRSSSACPRSLCMLSTTS
jgi:hypothetical protein